MTAELSFKNKQNRLIPAVVSIQHSGKCYWYVTKKRIYLHGLKVVTLFSIFLIILGGHSLKCKKKYVRWCAQFHKHLNSKIWITK